MSASTLPKTYDFQATEKRTYDWWEKNGYFKPFNDPNLPAFDPQAKSFVISIPPPNVTGELHLGHAMFVSMEDLMIRYHRMKGYSTLWVPGSDHAGIATQLQVEKMIAKEGLSREQLGREEFLNRTWAWKEKYGGIIVDQIRRLGASCDWGRQRFTLDEGLSRAVREAFVRLYQKGLIYRGPRLINWSPGLRTAVSDLEVEYSEEQGTLYFFKYVLADNPEEYLPVATTRPETILGDSAVAVHPEDERYQKYVGRMVRVPMIGREIPIIADEAVEREFGGGALKVTPGHDPTDYQIGLRHNLPVISILDDLANVNENGGPYQGLDRYEARKKIWEDMRGAGLVIKEEPYIISVPRSQRGGEVVEPMVSTQWFMQMKPLADAALQAVRSGQIKIIPERFTKVYYNWLENIQDWCISRQLWWGHRIPVWYCEQCGHMTVSQTDPTECEHCHSPEIHQDSDVLDTWFSSGLWPFSTLGWPEQTADYEYFYPTSYMETGYDILFFWVARMIMLGLEFTGKAPFNTVYLHGLIRDETGRKMSKTYGNVIDPLQIMDELGTDALRFTLLVGSTPGNDMNLSSKKVEANRNFANKIWNAGRFVIAALGDLPGETQTDLSLLNKTDWTLADSWIWARLQNLVREVERLFQGFQYGEAGRQIYEFFWGDFADWYLEIAKLQLSQGSERAAKTAYTLVRVFDTSLRLLHPFTPFVTEELWGHLKKSSLDSPLGAVLNEWPDALIIADWPSAGSPEGWENEKTAHFGILQEIVRSIRNIRSEKNVKPGQRIPAVIVSNAMSEMLESQKDTIAMLANLDIKRLQFLKAIDQKPEGAIAIVASNVEIFIPLADLVNVEEERRRLEKDLMDIGEQIERLETLLNSPFAEKAPPSIVQKEREKLTEFKESREKISDQLAALK